MHYCIPLLYHHHDHSIVFFIFHFHSIPLYNYYDHSNGLQINRTCNQPIASKFTPLAIGYDTLLPALTQSLPSNQSLYSAHYKAHATKDKQDMHGTAASQQCENVPCSTSL